jgi:hypothetical protein
MTARQDRQLSVTPNFVFAPTGIQISGTLAAVPGN